MKLTRDLFKDFFGNRSKRVAPLILLGALASGATQDGSDGKSLRFTKNSSRQPLRNRTGKYRWMISDKLFVTRRDEM